MCFAKFVFFGPIEKQYGCPKLISDWLKHYRLPLCNCKTDLIKLDRNQDFNFLYQVFVSPAKHSDTFGSLCSSSVCLSVRLSHLPKLCFAGDTCIPRNAATILCLFEYGRPYLWLDETFSTIHLDPINEIWWNFTGSKFSMSSTNYVFLAKQKKKTPWLICQQMWHMWLFGPLVMFPLGPTRYYTYCIPHANGHLGPHSNSRRRCPRSFKFGR